MSRLKHNEHNFEVTFEGPTNESKIYFMDIFGSLVKSKTKKGQDIRLSICSYVARLIVAPLVAICISAID